LTQLESELERIQGIAVAKDDQGSCCDRTKQSRRELHVIGCRSHGPRLLHKPFNLLLAAFAAFAHRRLFHLG